MIQTTAKINGNLQGTQAAGLDRLGAEVARFARVAVGVHMAETARPAHEVRDQAARLRELVNAMKNGGLA